MLEGVARGVRRPKAAAVLRPRARKRERASEPGAAPPLGFSRWTWLALALAAALRLWNVGHGLPHFLEEAIPFRRALEMWGEPGRGIDWNPHFYQYPSLTIYLHLFLQLAGFQVGRWLGVYPTPVDWHFTYLVDPTSTVLVARLPHVIADVITVAMAARLGERLRRGAGGPVALLVACSPTMIQASRAIFTDTVMAALAMAALDRMLAWRERGGRGRLAASAVLLGLAAGAKYPAVVLLAPLAWIAWERERARALVLWPAAAALSAVTFLATTPGAVFDAAAFTRDLTIVKGLAERGHLGSLGPAFQFYLGGLAAGIGWHGIVMAGGALIALVARPATRGVATTLALALLAFAVPISIGRAEAERYLIPVLPLAVVFLVAGLLEITGRLRPPLARPAPLALIGLFAIPGLWAGVRSSGSSPEDTQIAALRWCESRAGEGTLIVQESYSGPLLSRALRVQMLRDTERLGASPIVRRRIEASRGFATVTIPLAVSGRTRTTVRRPGREPVELEVAPHVVDLNRMVYEPRLLAGVDLVMTSSAVRHRFEADRPRFVVENRFYALLDSTAEIAARIAARGPQSGPDITIYRLGPRAREAIADLGPLDPLWWVESVPRAYRERANALFARPGELPALAPRGADGEPSPWARSLRGLYEERVDPFVSALAVELRQLDRCAPARALAHATLEIMPGNVQACLLHADCSATLGEWRAARAAIERAIAAIGAAGAPPALRLQYAETLARTGDLAGAKRELELVASSPDPVLAARARATLESPGGPFRAVP
jgi:hypothetical protein